MEMYQLANAEMPWGDYGDILLTGLARRDAETGDLLVERAGPFVPPITLAVGTLVVTNAFRKTLETSGLTGLNFRRAHKHRIVDLDWRSWDLAAEDPPVYPASGEPEDYILGRKHQPALAERMETLLEAAIEHVLEDVAQVGWSDFIRKFDSPFGGVLVSSKAREWLDAKARAWVSFQGPRTLDDTTPTW